MKKMILKAVFIIPLFMCIFFVIAPAQADDSEYLIPTLVKKNIGKLEIDLTASLITGYDSNMDLDRYDEDSSLFMQDRLGIAARYPISDIFLLRTSYDLTSTKYFKSSSPDMVDNVLGVGIDTKVTDYLLWSVDYAADFVDFPHDKFSDHTINEFETAIKQDITDWLYHKLGYEFSYKHYPKWKTRNSWGSLRMGDRHDRRNTVSHEIGMYIQDKTFIRATNKILFNDSNESFLRYYDYNAYAARAELNHLITDKLYGVVNFGYQYKDYTKRGITASDEDQYDHLFSYGGAVFYDVIPTVSIGTTFDYSDNCSNENSEQYEDILVTTGVYCSF